MISLTNENTEFYSIDMTYIFCTLEPLHEGLLDKVWSNYAFVIDQV